MKFKIIIVTATALAVACAAWLGYVVGTQRPRVVWTHFGGTETAFGWDAANHCIATWSRDTNGGFSSWTRLK